MLIKIITLYPLWLWIAKPTWVNRVSICSMLQHSLCLSVYPYACSLVLPPAAGMVSEALCGCHLYHRDSPANDVLLARPLPPCFCRICSSETRTNSLLVFYPSASPPPWLGTHTSYPSGSKSGVWCACMCSKWACPCCIFHPSDRSGFSVHSLWWDTSRVCCLCCLLLYALLKICGLW